MNKRINRYSAEASSALPNGLFLLACAAAAGALLWDAASGSLVMWQPLADYWAYVAVIQQWLQNPATLSNPLVSDTALSPQFVPLFWFLAVVGRLLGMDAMQLLMAGAIINFLLLATGLKLFLTDYFREPWAPVIGLLVVLCGWGVAGSGPGLFRLSSFLQVAGDPSTFAFALSLVAFWVTMRLLRSEATLVIWAAGLLLLVAMIFLSHPLTGLFCVVSCGLLAVTEFATSLLSRLAVLLAAFVGLVCAELWPYFSPWKLLLGLYVGDLDNWSATALLGATLEQGAADYWAPLLYDPSSLLAVFGVSLIGLFLVLRLLQRGEQPFIVYGAVVMLLPYLLHLVIDVPLVHRFVLFAVFYFQLALTWGWFRLISLWSATPRSVMAAPMLLLSVIGVIALVAVNYWLVQQEKQGRAFDAQSLQLQDSRAATAGKNVPELYGALLATVADDAVIIASPAVGWPVPAFKGRLVSLLNPNPLLQDAAERNALTDEFFYQKPADLQRVATVQRYNISHVLLNQADSSMQGELRNWLTRYSRPVAEQGSYRLYELAAALHQIPLPKLVEPEAEQAAAEVDGQPEADPVSSVEPPRDAVPAAQQESQAEQEDKPRSFGAPIAAPVLDPERHGGQKN